MSVTPLYLSAILLLACITSRAQEDSIWHNFRKKSSLQDSKISSINKKTDSIIYSIQDIPLKYINQVDKKIEQYSDRITNKTEKTLAKLSKWEIKIKSLLEKASPETAKRLFAPNQPTFLTLLQKYKEGKGVVDKYKANYNEYRSKLTNNIKYISTQKEKLDAKFIKPVQTTSKKLDDLERDIANTEAVEKFIKERKKQLIDEAVKYIGKSKYLAKISKESYYYVETLRNYKEIFSDSKKAEQTAKTILNNIPAFKKFTQQNSALNSLFGNSSVATAPNLAGLQTRASVNTLVQNRIAAGGPNGREIVSQSIQQAQAELLKLKEKIIKSGGKSSSDDIPDFKPNKQRSKTFLQRLEYEFNCQFAKTNAYLPATADLALSVGYKMNDKSIAGIGIAYKIGVGKIDHIQFTNQGIGIRSFIDWKLKKQFFVTGGFEMNHNAAFKNISELKQYNAWQTAGIIGISKKINLKTKLTKGTKLQFLYDMLHNQHSPASQPFLFRIGYSF